MLLDIKLNIKLISDLDLKIQRLNFSIWNKKMIVSKKSD